MLARLQAALRRLLFLDVSPLIKLGRRKVLTAEDMPPLPAHLDPRRSSEGFLRLPLDNAWHFLAACIRAVRPRWLRVLALACLMLGGELLSPQLVFQILSYIEQAARGASPLWVGLVWASCLVATSIVHALVMQHYFYQALSLVGETTNGLNFRIYRRALTLNRHERLTRPTGDLVNLMGSDAEAVAQFSWVSIEVGYALALIVGATFMLFRFIGVAAFAALGVLILMAPLTRLLGKRFVHIDGQLMAARDCRVTMIAQLLNGIRIVKYFTWEAKVLADVGEARKQELAHKKRLIIAESFSLLLYASTNSLVSLAAFACHIWLGHSLDAATIFACIGLFIAMEHPFGNLTELLGHSATARVSAIRLMHFLDDPTETVGSEEALPSTVATAAPAAACELSLSGLTAAYPDAPGRPVLADIELHIKSGECVALVGPVGSGKSSLLLAILGELGETAGEIRFGNAQDGQGRPRIAWVPQQAFICNRSLADNITLGGDPTRLDEAVYLACLNRDLSQLPAGLATEIGEQGINLSGGQKQRVALARAHLYDAPLVLLDDSLSAVDETTERQLMSELICGAWRAKTRLMVTHRLAHLHLFDRVVFMEEQRIVDAAPFAELYQRCERFKRFYREFSRTGPRPAPPKESVDEGTAAVHRHHGAEQPNKRITMEEDRLKGHVSPLVFGTYIRAMAGSVGYLRPWVMAALPASTLAVALVPVMQNAWLALWSKPEAARLSWIEALLAPWHGDHQHNLKVYAALGLLLLAAFFAQHLLWALRSLAASRQLHATAFAAVVHTRLAFFDANPIGRILNRFSQDVEAVEKRLPASFEQAIRSGTTVLIALAVLVSIMPATLYVVLPVLFIYYHLQEDFRRSSREAKRLVSISKSPRFAHFKETLEGLLVIRSLGKGQHFMERYFDAMGEWQRMYHAMVLLNRWFSIRIPLLSGAISGVVASGLVFTASRGAIEPGTAGLVLIYSLHLWGNLNWCIRAFSEAEAQLVSIERLRAFGELVPEPPVSAPVRPSAIVSSWPRNASIECREVSARYGDHLPLVLRDLSFQIASGRKVGVIGRTGSGKSTLVQIFYRFLEPEKGEIRIGGCPINAIPLERLRRTLSIIPQDPILFAGTLRDNIDRIGLYSDAAVKCALERAHLGFLPAGLSTAIAENGANLSQGQRQLVCLARALLVDSPIIMMDEATASVDVETDQLIQATIRKECANKTVVIIAHRLATLRDCDMVIELAHGKVASTWTPSSLAPSQLAIVTEPLSSL